jgi:hypothetical protein
LSEHARQTGRFAHRIRTGIWLFDEGRRDLPGTLFTNGFLHSIGRLILAASFPAEAQVLYGDGPSSGLFVRRDWSLAERLQFGADSVEVADYTFGKLQLPESTAAVARLAERPSAHVEPAVSNQAALIRLSSRLASAAGYGLTTRVSYLEILQDEFWVPYVDAGVIDGATSENIRTEFPALRRAGTRSDAISRLGADRESKPGRSTSDAGHRLADSADDARTSSSS